VALAIAGLLVYKFGSFKACYLIEGSMTEGSNDNVFEQTVAV